MKRHLALLMSGVVAVPVSAQVADPVPADAVPADESGDIIVTAQKRAQNLQDVPLSIQALDTATLTERSVASFNDYAKFLPSLSYASIGPGQAEIFFRGISNGNRLSTGSLPTVGVYLDEQPVTTIGAALDVHIYDIARVEALAGPQGTLFGASSEAGTLRIITNKPDPGKFAGGADLTATQVQKGQAGGMAEGFLNIPLSDRLALRVVGFYQRDGGYIDNVRDPGARPFPTSGIVRDNSARLGNDLNGIDTYGGRAALGIELDDSWTATPSIIYQHQQSSGTFGYRRRLGDLNNARYGPDATLDRWYQAALVIEGKVGRFDVTYAGGYLERTARYTSDYSDYAFFYDRYYESTPEYFGVQFFDNRGTLIDPSQILTQNENFTKQSHEIRVASPQSDRFRVLAGLFYQRQTNDWTNLYLVPGLADRQSVTGRPGVNYANIQFRADRDYAAFAEASFDILPSVTLTGGLRAYRYDNDVFGFFGYNATRSAVGEALCFPETIGAFGTQRPCNNIDAEAKGSGLRHKLNLTWRPAKAKLLYATWSTGFRPGGINRRPAAPPYQAEELSNYEIGVKTNWFGGTLRINGDIFLEKLTQAQFGVSSEQNGITDIVNAGRAESKGVEADITVLPARGLSLQASGTYVDATLSTNLCQYPNAQFDCTLPSPSGNRNSFVARAGARFPSTPRVKLTGTARYEFALGAIDAHVQGSGFYQSSVRTSLSGVEARLLGVQPAYTTADFIVGGTRDGWSIDLAVENAFDSRAQQLKTYSCNIELCGRAAVQILPIRPRLFSLRIARRF